MALKKYILEKCLAGSLGIAAAQTVIGKCKELCTARGETSAEGKYIIKIQVRTWPCTEENCYLNKLINQLTMISVFQIIILVS